MPIHVAGVSGSLRAASINTAVLNAIAHALPGDMTFELFGDMADLPLFNVDREPHLPDVVVRWQRHINNADVLLIASPEYAHGISGVMKNSLDWLVSCGVMVNKSVVVLNTSPRAVHAVIALCETLHMMSARVEAPILISPAQTNAGGQDPPVFTLSSLQAVFPLVRRMAYLYRAVSINPSPD